MVQQIQAELRFSVGRFLMSSNFKHIRKIIKLCIKTLRDSVDERVYTRIYHGKSWQLIHLFHS